jgi:hypothetical protein
MLKERMHEIYNTLPFCNMPPCIVIEMAKNAIYWLNSFPHPNGVSEHLNPRTIITGQTVDLIAIVNSNLGNMCKRMNSTITAWCHALLVPLPCTQMETRKVTILFHLVHWMNHQPHTCHGVAYA